LKVNPTFSPFAHAGIALSLIKSSQWTDAIKHLSLMFETPSSQQIMQIKSLSVVIATFILCNQGNLNRSLEYLSFGLNTQFNSFSWLHNWTELEILNIKLKGQLEEDAYSVGWEPLSDLLILMRVAMAARGSKKGRKLNVFHSK
jgi:methionine-rich copper-binding protein CopC